ncbi:unnamed protein product [Cuscuta epithymum]|uniref:Retrotransposon Copia-like N-terminal domain-containing protein n=1 Tax=Cuscuta epithymum TaxID=186058 RepID=A0AAV0FCH6_9ASTE|nr:unnamed protein product [Cuscuta epithymum]
MAIGEVTVTPKIEYTSPYYLGPQDRPGDFITPVRLTGENYDDWSSSVRLALRARRKFVFVNGVINEPQPPCTEEDWLTIHSMLVSWILNTISPEVKLTLSKFDDAKLLWNDLKERFSVVDGPKIYQVKTDIARCEQSKSQSVATYYGKLKVLWDELNNYEPLINCSCGKCTCKVNTLHEQRRESERFHQFLMGLSSEFYGQIRSQLLSQTPLPTLNRAFQQISQEERVRGMVQSKERDENNEVMGFALRSDIQGKLKYEKIDKSGLTCTHCKSRGHTSASCFEIKGYPEWWGSRPRLSERNVKYFPPSDGRTMHRGQKNAAAKVNSTIISRPTVNPAGMEHHLISPAASLQLMHASNTPGPSQPTSATCSSDVYFNDNGPQHAAHLSGQQDFSMAVSSSGQLPTADHGSGRSIFSEAQWHALMAAFGQPPSPSNRMHGPSNEEADWTG